MNQGLKKLISSREAGGARVPDLIKVSPILPETKSTEAIKVIKRLRVPLNQLTCLVNLLLSREGGQGSVVKDPGRGHCRWAWIWALLRGPLGGQKLLHRAQEPGLSQNLKDAGRGGGGGDDTGQVRSGAGCCVSGIVCCPSLGLSLHTSCPPMTEETGFLGSAPELAFQI